MATASIDFTMQQQTEVYKDSPTQSELTSMTSIGAILKPLYDAEQTFVGRFTPQMAMQVFAFRDAYWTPKSHDTVLINGVEMTWNDFVTEFFGVTRRWLNKVLKRYLAPTTNEDDAAEGAEVDEDNGDDAADVACEMCDVHLQQRNEACDRINELETKVEQLTEELEQVKVAQQLSPAGTDELDEVAHVIQRHAVNSVPVYARILERLIEKAGFNDRIKVMVE